MLFQKGYYLRYALKSLEAPHPEFIRHIAARSNFVDIFQPDDFQK